MSLLIKHLSIIPLRKKTLNPPSIKPHPLDIAEFDRTSTPIRNR